MIHVLLTAAHRYTLDMFLARPTCTVRDRVVVRPYDTLDVAELLAAEGPVVLADLERLAAPYRQRLADLADRLEAHGRRVLNHPAKAMLRYQLLRHLHDRGINRANVYRVTDNRPPKRWPVFVRNASDHDGSRTVLLQDIGHLRRALDAMRRDGIPFDDLLIVEFLPTAEEGGVYVKYGAFVFGEAIVPRHVMFSRHWVVKTNKLDGAEWGARELDYVQTNPHEAALRDILRGTGIDYGRIDYSVLDGQIQVWEINTNPILFHARHGERPFRQPAIDLSMTLLDAGWTTFDVPEDAPAQASR